MRSTAPIVVALLLAAIVCGSCARRDDHQVEVRVRRVAMDPASHSPVVLLEDPGGNVALPIWIGATEAQAIAVQLAGDTSPRPLTHDLVKTMFDRVGVGLQRILIRDLRDGTYFADIVLERDGKEVTVDSRPSDAIALAVRFGRPIFVERQLFAREAVVQMRDRASDDVVTVGGMTVQGMSAELARYFDLPAGHGVVVSDVGAGGPSVLHRGDVILEIDGETVLDARDFRAKLRDGAGQAALRVQREGDRLDVALERDSAFDRSDPGP
ncbi:MAG TPA: bifunctional nuclease domain-containing protein [Candidatus Dormibacteraeota bacterium]|nr:bifunctional nuclease domain-containing protein [Candidatus Dormibacteraeota bacterium]